MSQDVLRGELEVADLILMVLGPLLSGSAIGLGLALSLARRRPGLAAIGGIAGGTVGAWAGVAVYRWVDIADLAIFQVCVLGGLLLGAIPLGWLMAGPKATAAGGGGSIGKPIYGLGCGVAIAGVLLSCVGNVLHGLASPPFGLLRLDENFKIVGVVAILGGMVALVLGLLGVRRTREKETGTESNR
jgi:hypothetical protein